MCRKVQQSRLVAQLYFRFLVKIKLLHFALLIAHFLKPYFA